MKKKQSLGVRIFALVMAAVLALGMIAAAIVYII